MLRTFETIKRSSFYKPRLAVNFPSRSFSDNASAEFGDDAQQITFFSEKINKTPLRGVMPQRMIYHPMIGISTLFYSVNSSPSISTTHVFLRS